MSEIKSLNNSELRYLTLLSKEYPTVQAVSSELINLNAILNLPKGTDHFMSDLHGEADAFEHILNNCSGVIREKVDLIFEDEMSEEERANFSSMIYYPLPKLEQVHQSIGDIKGWYEKTLYRLIRLTRQIASKYTRSYVRKKLPKEYCYIIDELLHTSGEEHNKEAYYSHIISTIISLDRADDFIVALSTAIKCLAVAALHIVGDIYDRGEHADKIMDMLASHHNTDVQWGNHDILWMGAASGNLCCIANVVNLALQYNTLEILETGYGISLRDLIGFAQENYSECTRFLPRTDDKKYYVKNNMDTLAKAHKAIAIIQFKLEGALLEKHPEYCMDDRRILHKIDLENKTVTIDGIAYPMEDTDFPTIDFNDPYKLTEGEACVINGLCESFRSSKRLIRHIEFLYTHGSIYKLVDGNLLFHGCIPLTESGEFVKVKLDDTNTLSGKAYMDFCDDMARKAFFRNDENAKDFMWYLWCGRQSPLFGRNKITTFERYFLSDENVKKEIKNPYYKLVYSAEICKKILHEFGLSTEISHIINGHVPVRTKDGESPIRADGKYIVIDGGFCKAYHHATGIAGYTLIYNSRCLRLVSHGHFPGKEIAINENKDIMTTSVVFEHTRKRRLVRDTDAGKKIIEKICDLKLLLDMYRN